MRHVLVTGATGFLGSALTRALLSRGDRVTAVGRDVRKCGVLERGGATVLGHDLATPLPAAALDGNHGIDAVVHCAALSSPSGPRAAFNRHNVRATQNMVSLAKTLGIRRFIYISTPAVYFRFADQHDVREDTVLPKPLTAYAETKLRGEDIVLEDPGIGPVVLRPRGLYGKGDTALLPRLLRAAGSGPLPLLRKGKAQTDITHIDDAVAAILAALHAPASVEGHTFNVSGGEGIAIKTIADTACARLGITPRWRPMPLTPLLALARLNEAAARLSPWPFEPRLTLYGLGLLAYSQTLDISKAARMLGWRPSVSFDEGLRRTFAP